MKYHMKIKPFSTSPHTPSTEICSARKRDASDGFQRVGVTVLAALSSALARLSAHAAFFHKPSIAALKQETAQSNGDVAFALGYYTPGDRGGGWFTWQTSTTNADDGGRYVASDSNLVTGR